MVDVRTLLAVLLIADLLLATMLWIGGGRRLREDLTLWCTSLLVQALAFALFAVRGSPQGAAMVMGATLLALSLTLQGASLLTFDRRHLPVWVHTAVIAGVAPPFALVIGDPANATLFGGLVFGALLLLVAVIAWQVRAPGGAAARRVMVVAYAAAALACCLRGIGAAITAEPMRGFVSPTLFESGLYLACYVAVLAGTFGFLLLHKDRADATARLLVTTDALTGAYSRASFREIAEREFSRVRRAGQPLSLILVDVDNFTEASGRHGPEFSEATLKRLAEIVRAALRKEDMIVRFAAAQLLIVLPDIPGPGAVVVAGRIRREVEEEAFEANGVSVPITVSAGVAARLDEGPESIDSLLTRAADALALAQRRGRNRVVALSLGRSLAA